jgi:hypothetical protein
MIMSVFAWRTAQPRVASSLLSTCFQRSLPALTALLASFGAPHIFTTTTKDASSLSRCEIIQTGIHIVVSLHHEHAKD